MNSPIIIECQRYGCMKNLLACYANCRFNQRCDDLRDLLTEQQGQAETLINDYLRTRESKPIRIQFLSRSLKFVPLEKLPAKKRKPESPTKKRKPKVSVKNRKPVVKTRKKK